MTSPNTSRRSTPHRQTQARESNLKRHSKLDQITKIDKTDRCSMSSNSSAALISLREAPKKAMSGAERAKAYRDRKKAKASTRAPRPSKPTPTSDSSGSLISEIRCAEPSEASAPQPARAVAPSLEFLSAASPGTPAPVTSPEVPCVTATVTPLAPAVTPSRLRLAPTALNASAIALAGVGMAINGWFARSLGSSDFAGWLFLALGMAADLVALGMPSCAANLWRARRRAASLVGWALWLVAFVFAAMAGLGFASTNVSDVTLARASRVTPAVTAAQAALADAMAARDRECKGGVGKFCREREAAVVERRQVLDLAAAAVGLVADPQTDAAIKLVSWASFGTLRPATEDFVMLRLILLALLPQLGGLLMLVARGPASGSKQNPPQRAGSSHV